MGRVKQETLSGAKWSMLQKCTVQPVQFVFGAFLARLISPSEFGILGLTAIFFAVANNLRSAGFASALIRKVDRTEEDCSTMFWFNWGMSCLMGAILFLMAPWFADFYHQPELLWLTRVSAMMMCVTCTGSVHWALYTARRDFKTPAIVQTVISLVFMPFCLLLAYWGWGVWALMTHTVVSSLASLITVWIISPWRPRLLWSWASFRELFGFGGKLALSGLIHVLYTDSRTFIIGKFYSPASLGYYNRGQHVAGMVPLTVNGMIEEVTYPILSTLQNDRSRLVSVYRKYIKVATLPIVWGLATLIALAEPAVSLVYGDKWLPCVVFLQIVCLGHTGTHICSINLNLLKVLGRSDLYLRLEIIKKTISIAMMLYAATISVEAICWAGAIYTQIAIFINTYYTGKILGLTWWRQQKDYMPYFFFAGLSSLPGYLLTLTALPSFVSLALGVAFSGGLYAFCLTLRKDEALLEYVQIFVRKIKWDFLSRWVRWLVKS